MTLGLFLIIIVVVPYCIYLYIKNKYLTLKLEELEQQNKEILSRKLTENETIDKISLSNITPPKKTSSKEIEELPKKDNQETEQNSFAKDNYSKNFQQDITKINTQDDYLKEVIKKLNDTIIKKTIDLTEYEKEQEKNAVISYEELKKEEKQKFIFKEEDEPTDFINNLKQFRNNLK